MNNKSADDIILACSSDLTKVAAIISGFGTGNAVVYLNRYAIMRASGAIELAFKTIVADYCSKRSKRQVKDFIDKKIREDSRNPTYSAICSLLGDFGTEWLRDFKTAMNGRSDREALILALQSLVDARNDFAHGGSPGATITDIIAYFEKGCIVIRELDAVVN